MCTDDTNEIIFRLLLLINTVQFLLCVTQAVFDTIFCFIVFTILPGDIQQYLHSVNVCKLASSVIFVVNVSLAIPVAPFVAD